MTAPLCTVCLNTGSKSQEMGGYLDCFSCDIADQRVKFREQMGEIKENVWGGATETLAWRAYQLGKAAGKPTQAAIDAIHMGGWQKGFSYSNSIMKNNEHYRERVFNQIIELDTADGLNRFTRVNSAAPVVPVAPQPVAWGLLSIQEPELTNDQGLAEYWARKGRSVTALYAAPQPAASVTDVAKDADRKDADRWRMHLNLMVKNGHRVREVGATIDAIDAAIAAQQGEKT